MDIRDLLVPTDFSEASKRVVEYAFGLAQICGTKLTLLHVVEQPSYLDNRHISSAQRAALQHHLESKAQQELARLRPRWEAQDLIPTEEDNRLPLQKREALLCPAHHTSAVC